jgi:hypothetical protein
MGSASGGTTAELLLREAAVPAPVERRLTESLRCVSDGNSNMDGARASCRSDPPASIAAVRLASVRPMSSAALTSTPSFSSP